jgi:hypothetical protein
VHSVAQTIGARLWNNSAILGALAAGVVALFASAAGMQAVVGGDTIQLDGTTFRIWGVYTLR